MDITGAVWFLFAVQLVVILHIADRMWRQKYKQLERVYSFTTVVACLMITCRLSVEFRTVNLILNKNLQRIPMVNLVLQLKPEIDINPVVVLYIFVLRASILLMVFLDWKFTYTIIPLK